MPSSRSFKVQSQPESNVFSIKKSVITEYISALFVHIFCTKHTVGKMRGNKVTGDDEVPGDVLKTLEENGLRIVTQLTNHIHDTGEWPKDFTEFIVITFK
jgi:hypothetical protein